MKQPVLSQFGGRPGGRGGTAGFFHGDLGGHSNAEIQEDYLIVNAQDYCHNFTRPCNWLRLTGSEPHPQEKPDPT